MEFHVIIWKHGIWYRTFFLARVSGFRFPESEFDSVLVPIC